MAEVLLFLAASGWTLAVMFFLYWRWEWRSHDATRRRLFDAWHGAATRDRPERMIGKPREEVKR